ncbi:MAG: thiamine pyrophosphate-binding protein [Caldilineaceae bacterium]
MMPKLNGGQAFIESLQREGVRTVFGIPGAGQYEAVDALVGRMDMRYISLRHEQAATYMADGYARVSEEIAAALVVQGPGLFNAASGMATAYAVSSRMLVVTGVQHQHGPAGQVTPDWYQPLAKWAARANRPSEIPAAVQMAFQQLRSGRPRPVVLEIPAQVLATTEDVQLLDPLPVIQPTGDPAQIERAVQLLTQAQRPLLWAGGGVQRAGAWDALQRLAEHLQAPVVTSRQGKGVLSEQHPLSLGMAELRYAPLREWIATRDLILAVGVQQNFSTYTQSIIQIDIDPAQISQGSHVCGLHGDAQQVLETLTQTVSTTIPARTVHTEGLHAEIRTLNAARFEPTRQLQPQWAFMQAIRAALPADGILVQGMNQMGYYSRNYFKPYAPRTYLTSSSLSTLGAAFPLALGAKVAQPHRAVLAIEGDGGFLYNAQELATAVQHKIPVVVLVFNDNAYGNVLRAQMEQFDGRVLGTRLHNPDFVKLAEAYGAQGVRVQDAVQLEAALRTAFANTKPTLLEVPVGPMQREF